MSRFDELIRVLRGAFPNAPIYDENIPQRFRQPCFSVLLVSEQHTPMTETLQQEYTTFDIRYFPPMGLSPREACRGMAGRLKEELRAMCEDRSYIIDMEYNIVDDVLHFMLNIDGCETIERVADAEPMENLTVAVDTGKPTMDTNDENMGKFTFEITKEA